MREEISYQLVEKYGFPLAEVARQPGVTTSAISRWKWRGGDRATEEGMGDFVDYVELLC
ncbi:MAG: hypothetical protein J7J91_11750 [Deltaproteobacteria bacterium]|nr:hypothetical protein [Deltaproteobacteria bacterium]